MALCPAALSAQERAVWETAGVSIPLAAEMEVQASGSDMFTARGGGITLHMRVVRDAGHPFVETLTDRAREIDRLAEERIAPSTGNVPDAFFDYLQERGYHPGGHSREVFFPVDHGIVGYMTESVDPEDKVLVAVLYSRTQNIPFILVARFPEIRGRNVGEMLMRLSTTASPDR